MTHCMVCGKGRYCLNCLVNGDNHAAIYNPVENMPETIWALKYPICEYADTKEHAKYKAELEGLDYITEYTRSDLVPHDADGALVEKLQGALEFLEWRVRTFMKDEVSKSPMTQQAMQIAKEALAEYEKRKRGSDVQIMKKVKTPKNKYKDSTPYDEGAE